MFSRLISTHKPAQGWLQQNIFSGSLYLSSPLGTPIMQMLVHSLLSQRSLGLSSFFFSFFFLYSVLHHFHHSVFQVTYPFFCFSYSTTDCSFLFFFFLLFSSSRSLVNICCIVSILFPRTWIIFTIIVLNYFSGRLPLSTSFSCFSGGLSCSFI